MRFSEFTVLQEDAAGLLKALNALSLPSFKSDDDTASPDSKPTPGKPGKPSADVSTIQDPDFNKKLEKVAKQLGVETESLRRIIKFETAGTFSPTSHDPWNVSIGLIGFTENTARALGTSKAALAKMTAVQQLDYVYKFYKMNGLRPGSDVGTMYMLTFMPAYAYHPDGTVLGRKNGPQLGRTGLSMHKIWLQNPGFGKSKGKDFFTVGDVKNTINSRR
jgi:hypothetical protein